MLKIQIIIGTTRQGRFSEKAADYMLQEAKKLEGIEAELVDLRDYPLPFFDEPISPSYMAAAGKSYENPAVKKWTDKVAEADGYIMVTSEYNHGYPAVLKNALDYVFTQWNRKAVGFVSYGSVGGARAIQQLRQVVIELQMVPIRSSVHVPTEVYMAAMGSTLPVDPELFKPLRVGHKDFIEAFFTDLIWTTKALKTARES